ncbi:MAG TPA: NAD(P)-dependent alcohol dehydrogenase [Candidatus Latescibacteria bacterium]|nr:NAD(P)-dependent alcohol dehydrogenase [Candidatus Latescibacterota bacterium]HOS63997.1 NAD(P)-dependent alcohol dehydrogenase [Candidatus Latescibacterota bacterium]HPK74852.1 NAD(P)-dependent alcohol dehydrogenase [Candidatus Latescibacterota bacterium]
MKAAVMRGIRDVRIEDIPVPPVLDEEALVRIRSVGVCGSDIHYYTHGKIGRYVVQPPFLLGHECAGEVVEVGAAVRNVRPGDLVAVEPGVPCRRCRFCREGRYNLCPDVVFLATPPVDGAFAEYIAHSADFLFPLDGVSLHEGAMCEPLSTGMQAVRRSGLRMGDTVFIAGVGPIGLCALQAFLAGGAAAVYVSDLDADRCRRAVALGATQAFDASDSELAAKLRDLTHGLGPDIVVETAGSEKATAQSVQMVRAGGVVVLIGLSPAAIIPIDTIAIIDKEIDIRGVFRYANTYPAALSMIRRGAVDVKSMITAEYPLDRAKQALDDVAARKPGVIKAMVVNG